MKINNDFDVEIFTLSPIHIGSGEEYLAGIDLIDGKVFEMNKLYNTLSNDQDKLNELTTFILSGDIKEFYDKNRSLFKDAFLYNVQIDNEGNNIKKFIRDGYGNLFLPGSSLKGSIRTAIIYSYFDSEKEFIKNNIKSIIDGYDQAKKDKSKTNKVNDEKITKKLLGKDPNHNLMRGLKVADSACIESNPIVYKVETFGSRKLLNFYEMLKSGVKIETKINIDRYVLNHSKELQIRNFDWDKLLDHIMTLSNRIASYHLGYSQKINNYEEFSSFFNELKESLSEDETIINIGAGIGWVGMTGNLLDESIVGGLDISLLRDALNLAKDYKNFPFPKTRKLVYDHLNNRYLPAGWIKIKIPGLKRSIRFEPKPIQNNLFVVNQNDAVNKEPQYKSKTSFTMMDSLNKNLAKEINYSDNNCYEGIITGVKDFGVFVKFNNHSGLVHKSKIGKKFLPIEKNFKIGDKVKVKVLEVKADGKINLQLVSDDLV
jgi:CRISPR type III-A-associated RAMP protein Csm5